jgi:hypothetical protein
VGGYIDFIVSRICIHHDQLAVIATGRNVIVDGRERNSVYLNISELIAKVGERQKKTDPIAVIS